MGSKGSNTTTSTYQPAGSGYINTALQTAQNAAATPYQAYNGELTAPVNNQQYTGIGAINQYSQAAQPYYQQAQGYISNAAQPIGASQINQYLNPYTQQVVNSTQAQFNNQNAQQQSQLTGNAAAQGALGGNRVAVAQSNLANQQQLAQAPVIAGLESQGYNTATQTALAEQQAQANAGYAEGNLGTAAQGSALAGAQSQVGAGTLEQQTQQAQDTSQYQQYLNALAYPFETSQFLTSATSALAPSLGGTTSTTQPPPNALAQYLGFGTALLGSVPGSAGSGASAYLPWGSSPSYGGGNVFSGDAYGGSAANPLPGLDSSDYAASGGRIVNRYAIGGAPTPTLNLNGMPASGAQNIVGGGLGYVPQSQITPAHQQIPQAPNPAGGGAASSGNSTSAIAGDVAKIASQIGPMLMGANKGGRIQGMDTGGVPDDSGISSAAPINVPQVSQDNSSAIGPQLAFNGTPMNYSPMIQSAAGQYGISPAFLSNQLGTESNFDPNAVSQAGAQGIAQFMPGTAAQYGVNPGSVPSSINGAAHYDADLKTNFGNEGLAAAAYNWGPGNVDKWLSSGADPSQMPAETRNYVQSVTGVPIQHWMNAPATGTSGNNALGYAAVATGDNYDPGVAAINSSISHQNSAAYDPQTAALNSAANPQSAPMTRFAQAQPQFTNNSQKTLLDSIWEGIGGQPLSDQAKQGVMAAGFGMMASRSPYLGTAIGEGGLQGMSTYDKAQEMARQAALAQSQIADQGSQIGYRNGPQTADTMSQTRQRDIQTAMEAQKLRIMQQAAQDPDIVGAGQAGQQPPGQMTPPPQNPSSPAGSDPAFNRPAAGLQTSSGTIPSSVPPTQAAAAGVQQTIAQTAGVMKTPQGQVVSVDGQGRPVENLATTLQRANKLITYGIQAGDAQMIQAGSQMRTEVQSQMQLGMQLEPNGTVAPIAGWAQSKADAAGQVAGAEAKAKFPYEFASNMARQAGRVQPVGPNQTIATAEQTSPYIKSMADVASQLLAQQAGTQSPPNAATPSANGPAPNAAPQQPAPAAPVGPNAQLGTPAGQNTSVFTPHLVQNQDGTWGSSVTPSVEAIQKDLAEQYGEAAKAAHASQQVKYRLDQVEHDLDQLGNAGGWYTPGAGANTRLDIAKTVNSYAQAAGFDAPFDLKNVGTWEDLNKETGSLGFALSRTMGAREAAQVVQQAIALNPGIANTPYGAKLVLNSLRYAAKADTDYYNYMTQYAGTHGGDLFSAQTEFQNKFPPSAYATAARVSADPAQQQYINYLKAHPDQDTMAKFDKRYGPGTARLMTEE